VCFCVGDFVHVFIYGMWKRRTKQIIILKKPMTLQKRLDLLKEMFVSNNPYALS
jgi:hypothetical protein